MYIGNYALGLLIADGAFVVAFVAVYWFQHFYSSLLAALVLVGAFTYFPLLRYLYECKRKQVKKSAWHNQYRMVPIFYGMARILFFFSILLVVLVESAGMDLSHAMHHLPTTSIVTLVILFILLMIILILALLLFYEHGMMYVPVDASYQHDFVEKLTIYNQHTKVQKTCESDSIKSVQAENQGQILVPSEQNRALFATRPKTNMHSVPSYQMHDADS